MKPDLKSWWPLSRPSRSALLETAEGPTPSHHHNPGVWDRLFREGLIEQVHSDKPHRLYVITDAGREKLRAPH